MNKNRQLVGVILSALAGVAALTFGLQLINDGEMMSLPTSGVTYPLQAIEFGTTPAELVKAYQNGAESADLKFKGRTFEITGAIDYISSASTDDVYIVLRAGIPFRNPRFHLGVSERANAFWLGKGMYVSLICVGDGSDAGVPISRSCVIGK